VRVINQVIRRRADGQGELCLGAEMRASEIKSACVTGGRPERRRADRDCSPHCSLPRWRLSRRWRGQGAEGPRGEEAARDKEPPLAEAKGAPANQRPTSGQQGAAQARSGAT